MWPFNHFIKKERKKRSKIEALLDIPQTSTTELDGVTIRSEEKEVSIRLSNPRVSIALPTRTVHAYVQDHKSIVKTKFGLTFLFPGLEKVYPGLIPYISIPKRTFIRDNTKKPPELRSVIIGGRPLKDLLIESDKKVNLKILNNQIMLKNRRIAKIFGINLKNTSLKLKPGIPVSLFNYISPIVIRSYKKEGEGYVKLLNPYVSVRLLSPKVHMHIHDQNQVVVETEFGLTFLFPKLETKYPGLHRYIWREDEKITLDQHIPQLQPKDHLINMSQPPQPRDFLIESNKKVNLKIYDNQIMINNKKIADIFVIKFRNASLKLEPGKPVSLFKYLANK